MSTIKRKAHYKALTELVEFMNIAFMLALFADAIWAVHELYSRGFNIVVFLVANMLWTSFFLVLFGVIKYHRTQVDKIIKDICLEKLANTAAKLKAKQQYERKHSKKVRAQ